MHPSARSSEQQTGSVPPKRSLRIVVVDDDRDTVLTLVALLRDEGHETRACYKGSEVYDCVKELDADVVLLDIALPAMNGWDVARQIRAQMPGGRPMLIGISGEYIRGPDKILAQMSGFDFYLMKPLDPKVLSYLLQGVGRSE